MNVDVEVEENAPQDQEHHLLEQTDPYLENSEISWNRTKRVLFNYIQQVDQVWLWKVKVQPLPTVQVLPFNRRKRKCRQKSAQTKGKSGPHQRDIGPGNFFLTTLHPVICQAELSARRQLKRTLNISGEQSLNLKHGSTTSISAIKSRVVSLISYLHFLEF